MALGERIKEIITPEEADSFIDSNPVAAIFKAGTCHKTMQGWGNVEMLLRQRDDVPVGIIRVVENRPASNRVAERSAVVHHSPQIILFKSGKPVFDLDNWDITLENLKPLFDAHLPANGAKAAKGGVVSDLEAYKRLLDQYLAGAISEQDFKWVYLNTFREDASLRSQEEFELLNSLFGNPDGHHIHPAAIMAYDASRPGVDPLTERAKALRERLNTL